MLQIKHLSIFLLFFTYASGADEVSFEKSEASTMELAKMLLEAELAGRHAHEGGQSHCLKQENFPLIDVTHFPPQERVPDYQVFYLKNFTIGELEVVNPDIEQYRLHFSVEVFKSDDQTQSQTFEDRIVFLRNSSKRVYQSNGHASILEPPQNIYLRKECFPK